MTTRSEALEPDPAELVAMSETLAPHVLGAARLCLPAQAEEDLNAMVDTAARLAFAGGVRLAPAVTEEQVEAAAKAALMVTQSAGVDPEYAWRVQDEEVREEMLAQARAILAALGVPVEAGGSDVCACGGEITPRYAPHGVCQNCYGTDDAPHSVPVDVTPGARGAAMVADPVGYLEAAREAAGGEGR